MPTMTVDDLLVKVRDAQRKMSRKNAHRVLFAQVEDALIQLATRVGELSVKETTDGATDPQPVGRSAQ